MYLDKLLQLGNAQEVTSSAASTNVVDFGASRDMGPGEPLCVVVTCEEDAASGGGSATVVVGLQTDSAEGFGTVKTVLSTPAIAQANITDGKVVAVIALPPSMQRYVRLYYTVASGPLTAGMFTAHIMPMAAVQTADASYSN